MALITDLRHFLKEDGSMADMPNPARNLAEYLGHIVKSVTTRQRDALATGVKCRRRFKRRKCPGEIIAFINEKEAISWSCLECKENGVISGGKGTIWDWSVNAKLIFEGETLKVQRRKKCLKCQTFRRVARGNFTPRPSQIRT